MSLLLASTVDVTIVLALAFAIAAVLRRRSASLRHGVIAAALVAAAAVPVIESQGPQWEWPVAWTSAAQTASTLRLTSASLPQVTAADVGATAAAAPLSWADALMLLWLAGAMVTAAGLVTGVARLIGVTRCCTVIDSGSWHQLALAMSRRYRLPRPVALLQSTDASLLLTWGLLRPKILLPRGADEWSVERREVVLAHELAHIRRGDWALQLAAEALRTVYWFNPLVWLACRRLRHESEYACDDAVLDAGVEATDYATHLLGVAQHAIGQRDAWASAPAIAHPSTLERRISAMLSRERNREPLTRRAWALAVGTAVVLTMPVAAITITERVADPVATVSPAGDVPLAAPTLDERRGVAAPDAPAPPAQQDPATVSGRLQDPSGAVLPGVELTLTDTQFGVRFSRVTDGGGFFAFPDLQPGRYELDARLPGFATVSNLMTITAGAKVERTITLPLGSLEETLYVVCSGGPLAMAPVPFVPVQARGGRGAVDQGGGRGFGQPLRVGGQIKVPNQIHKVNPVCPRTVLPERDTVINLIARIDVDGYMNEVRHVPADNQPAPPAEFIDSALEAVRQWRYTPTLLNNQPWTVNVRVTVLFSRNIRRA
jgi:beta-lactamase regulating signal transducer with metallopeptidase domain